MGGVPKIDDVSIFRNMDYAQRVRVKEAVSTHPARTTDSQWVERKGVRKKWSWYPCQGPQKVVDTAKGGPPLL